MFSWIPRLTPEDHFADFFFGGEFNNKKLFGKLLDPGTYCPSFFSEFPRFFLNLALAIPKIENLGTLKYLKNIFFCAGRPLRPSLLFLFERDVNQTVSSGQIYTPVLKYGLRAIFDSKSVRISFGFLRI